MGITRAWHSSFSDMRENHRLARCTMLVMLLTSWVYPPSSKADEVDLAAQIKASSGFTIDARNARVIQQLPIPPAASPEELATPCRDSQPRFESETVRKEWIKANMSKQLLFWAVGHDGARAGTAQDKGCLDLDYAARRWQTAKGLTPDTPLTMADIEMIDRAWKQIYRPGYVEPSRYFSERDLANGATLESLTERQRSALTDAGKAEWLARKTEQGRQDILRRMPAVELLPSPPAGFAAQACSHQGRIPQPWQDFFFRVPEMLAWKDYHGLSNCSPAAIAETWFAALGAVNGRFDDANLQRRSMDTLAQARTQIAQAKTQNICASNRAGNEAAWASLPGTTETFKALGLELGASLPLPWCSGEARDTTSPCWVNKGGTVSGIFGEKVKCPPGLTKGLTPGLLRYPSPAPGGSVRVFQDQVVLVDGHLVMVLHHFERSELAQVRREMASVFGPAGPEKEECRKTDLVEEDEYGYRTTVAPGTWACYWHQEFSGIQPRRTATINCLKPNGNCTVHMTHPRSLPGPRYAQ